MDKRIVAFTALALTGLGAAVSGLFGQQQTEALPRANGYRGIWYYNQPTHDKYAYKYSGGFATYPQQQSPIAIYSKAAQKTFFCYGGTVPGKQELLHMVSYYDHRTGQVPRPVTLVNKKTDDAHDNPVMAIDDDGHIWIFSNSHGTSRPSYIWRSAEPYKIDRFDLIKTTNFSYSHPSYISGKGFFFLHTLYRDRGRSLFWTSSKDGKAWDEPSPLSRIDQGHYEITARLGNRIVTAFNYHPSPLGLNARTNLYFLQTEDMGKTWMTIDRKPITPPLKQVHNAALAHDFQKEGLLVYLKSIDFDASGNPVILILNSKAFASGPAGAPRTWKTMRWTGKDWEILPFTMSDHNYDYGFLSVEKDGTWRVIATTAPGPQPDTTGGDVVLWTSADRGHTWRNSKQLTHAKKYNHTYPKKPIDAQADFYALWADGDTLRPSESSLYFTNRAGSAVWKLPSQMTSDFAKPAKINE